MSIDCGDVYPASVPIDLFGLLRGSAMQNADDELLLF